jgi:hypothetical protein
MRAKQIHARRRLVSTGVPSLPIPLPDGAACRQCEDYLRRTTRVVLRAYGVVASFVQVVVTMEAYGPGKNANGERSDGCAMPAGLSPTKIDVGRYVAEIERMLCSGGRRPQRTQALAILRRWQFDEMLDDASRQRAKVLIWRFAGND